MSLASEIKNSKRYFKHLRALPAQISKKGQEMNIEKTLNALNDVSTNVIDLKNELNAKLNDELLHKLVRIEGSYADYSLSIDVNYDVCEDGNYKLSIVVNYIERASTRNPIDFEIYCDRIRLIINTTTRDAQKIASLAQFCERNILGGLNDE
ncbi:hypothetical protein CINF_1269 [Candidatus Campylobacter infans]|uniref:Uncharacterized protein n=1 Tax=Candidatus Campylobacter infans TaxID=2561898 RepID=A0A7H9CKD8_9BACT|nr:hypothetical protein [Candidatus Campylobacter infans]QLI05755.1 hypothetical protein CINF_1269 [Candidatus Campylobacter infans]